MKYEPPAATTKQKCFYMYYSEISFTNIQVSKGLFTFTGADPDSNPIPVVCSWDGNLNLTPSIVKSSAEYNLAI